MKIYYPFILASLALIVFTDCNHSGKTSYKEKDSSLAVVEQPMTAKEEQGVMVGGANMVPSKNVMENIAASQEHTTLATAILAAGLGETLSGTGPFTVFAPTNGSFNKLIKGTVPGLLTAEKKQDLIKILSCHIVPGSLMTADLTNGQLLKTLEGKDLVVAVKNGRIKINGADITIADIVSGNGIIHVIDKVLTP